jgi:hypothetical protein
LGLFFYADVLAMRSMQSRRCLLLSPKSDAGLAEALSTLTADGQELAFVGRSMIFSENRSENRPAPVGIMFW